MSTTILIADDNRDVLLAFQRFFLDTDCNILSTRTGRAALEMIGRMPVSLLVASTGLPDMAFPAFLLECRTLAPRLNIMGIDDAVGTTDAPGAEAAGLVCMLSKPLELGQLQHWVRQCGIALPGDVGGRGAERSIES